MSVISHGDGNGKLGGKMKVKSEIFRDESYGSLVDRIEGILELLLKQGNTIISVTITTDKYYYLGTIFFQEDV